MANNYYVYIMANIHNKVLYVGVTNNIRRRVYEHKNKIIKGFTQKYNICKLVYYEIYNDIEEAISREKKIKGESRAKKDALINSFNSRWEDLYERIL